MRAAAPFELRMRHVEKGCSMIRNQALALVSTESKASACAHEPIVRYEDACFSMRDDRVVQEVELSVFVNGVPYRDVTCSPWDVKELVVGGLFLAGELESCEHVHRVEVDLDAGIASVSMDSPHRRRCGVKELCDGGVLLTGVFPSAEVEPFKPVVSRLSVSARAVVERVALLEDRSTLFRRTGGVHSAVLVDDRGVVAWFEDIGRHSAMDKLAGWCFLNHVDVSGKMLLFSGRVPREIIVKVIRLGCPIVASPGAPTNLSMRLAQRWGVTLVGFAKHGAFNVYAHPERIR